MLRTEIQTLTTRRLVVGVLVLLSGFLMSARSPESPIREGQAQAYEAGSGQPLKTRPGVAQNAEEVIASLNPSLSAHERARIGAAVERYSAAYSLDPDLVLGVIFSWI